MSILTTSDFSNYGKFELHTGQFDNQRLQNYIDKYESRYLKQLFGVELYNQFNVDLLNNFPQSPNFAFIFDAFATDYHYEIVDSDGVVEMLKGFIYFEYSKDLINQMTPFGNVNPKSENSDVASTIYSQIYTRYNDAIRTFRAIQHHIYHNQHEPVGQLVNLSLINGGTGYVDGQFDVLNGTGTGALLDVTTDGFGVVTDVVIISNGEDYSTGDVLTIDSGDFNAEILVDYVGTGDFSKFNGQRKEFIYWL